MTHTRPRDACQTPASRQPRVRPGSVSTNSSRSTPFAILPPNTIWPWPPNFVHCLHSVLRARTFSPTQLTFARPSNDRASLTAQQPTTGLRPMTGHQQVQPHPARGVRLQRALDVQYSPLSCPRALGRLLQSPSTPYGYRWPIPVPASHQQRRREAQLARPESAESAATAW